MAKLVKNSLWQTLDSLNDDLFHNRQVPKARKLEIARWIAGRQGLAGTYAGMPAPTEKDYQTGIQVFTGERMTSGAGTGHILGEEACRALLVLNVRDKSVNAALKRATDGIGSRIKETAQARGWY